jgi:alpha-galactosidase
LQKEKQSMSVRIVIIGAGSRSFGPAMIRDIALSAPLTDAGVELFLVDLFKDRAEEMAAYARHAAGQCGHGLTVTASDDVEAVLPGAAFVITAFEVDRFKYWTQDFHIPRDYGFRQVFGENGGIAGLFHALRNMGPMVDIARHMERLCPSAMLLNFANPEHKLCEAVSRLTGIQAVGLCHGYFMGLHQIAAILGRPAGEIDGRAYGMNHFTVFTDLRDRATGEDLYPTLRAREREGDWLSDWHEIGLARVLLRRFGLWPSPAANHYGEYIRWADEFVASELQFFHDPADGPPWETGVIPEFVYSLSGDQTTRPWIRPEAPPARLEDAPLQSSGELAVPIMEGIACGVVRTIEAVNMPNSGAIPNLPDDMVIEGPADVDARGLRFLNTTPLPEGIAALLRTQASINALLVEAFAEQSKAKLLQAILLDPTVDSYRRAVNCMEELLRLQRDILPPLE